jgi:F-type H+-transporting ATPase subunit epsilon
MHLSVITPERTIVDAEVTEVTAPGEAGQLGVLPDHVTFLGNLQAGEVRYKAADGAGTLIMSGGLIEVQDNRITILAGDALRADQVDVEAARRDLEQARASRESLDPYGDAYAAAVAAERWAELRIQTAAPALKH